jgi:hypothetical protein
MSEKLMLESLFPGGSLKGGIQFANRLDWGLTVQNAADYWVISSGDQVLLRTESRKALEPFVYGMGLAYAVIPEKIFSELEAALDDV